MNRSIFPCSWAIVAVLGFGPTAPVFAQSPVANPAPNTSKPAPAVIGVVDPVKVFDAYPKAAAGLKQLGEKGKSMKEEIKGAERRLEGLKLERDGLKAGSRERALKEIELQLSLKDYDLRKQFFDLEFDQQRDEFLVSIYEDIEKATEAVARNRGIDLVLRVHSDVGDGSVASRGRVMERRIVWYASESIDLTPDIVRWLQVQLPETPKTGAAKDAPNKDAAAKEAASKPGNGGSDGNKK